MNKADWIEGMARGMAVLESFDTERQRLNATLTAQRTGLTRAAARRHLLTLTQLGYLESDGQYYWLSAKVLGFAGSYLSGARLPRAVQPTLHQLSLSTQLSCSVAVLQNDAVIIVARGIWQGPDLPAKASHAVLAYGLHVSACACHIHRSSATGQFVPRANESMARSQPPEPLNSPYRNAGERPETKAQTNRQTRLLLSHTRA
jgi:IclR helix-turn-helix domain